METPVIEKVVMECLSELQREQAESIWTELFDGFFHNSFTKHLVCGSIRRKKPEVNDIDIVAIPKELDGYFGETLPTIDRIITKLDPKGLEESKQLGKSGVERFSLGVSIKRFRYNGISIDIYLADQNTFETLVLIRTGSREHNIILTTTARSKGLKLFASGKGLCKVSMDGKKEIIIIDEIVENTEDGILLRLLGRVPKPEERI